MTECPEHALAWLDAISEMCTKVYVFRKPLQDIISLGKACAATKYGRNHIMRATGNRLDDLDCVVVLLYERCVNIKLSRYIVDQFIVERHVPAQCSCR